MREMIAKQIDDETYQITQFMPSKAFDILEQLGNIVGEPLGTGVALYMSGQGEQSEVKDNDLDEAKLIGKAVRQLFVNMKENNALGLIKKISSGDSVLCDSKQINFDTHYQGRLGHLFKVVFAVLEVNYSDFLGGLTDSAGAGLVGSGGMFQSLQQKMSTGESGA